MFQDAHIRTIAKFVGIAAVIALGAYTYYAISQAQYITNMPTTISVDGTGEVFAKPDVAIFTFSVNAKEVDAAAAQKKAAESMNSIVAFLKEKGVDERDVKTTGYYMNPRYEYPEVRCMDWGCPPYTGEQTLAGYEVAQSIEVKVRKTEDAGLLIVGVGERGATNVGGLIFTIDDDESLKAVAREAAILDAREKAEVLADKLGVRIIRVNGFWENQGGSPMYDYGYGGASMDMKSESVAPQVPVGENTIVSTVSISYEVR